ncbi:MAG: thioredoxin fold domain-containing protein [Rhodothermales bacterium]
MKTPARFLLLLVFVATAATDVQAQIETTTDNMIVWPSFQEAFDAAVGSDKIVLIDVWSRNCGWCRKQQTEVYTQPELQDILATHFEIGRLDIDVATDTISFRGYDLSSAELAAGLGASGTPTTIFMEPSGSYITRLGGFHPYDDFVNVLQFIGTESFREMSFQDYVATLPAAKP